MKTWGLLDWIGVGSLTAAALILAINAALKDAPVLAEKAPAFLSWSYLPLALLLIAFAVLLYRVSKAAPSKEGEHQSEPPENGGKLPYAPRREWRGPMVGPFKIVNDPPADFRLLPVHYSVDLTVPLPYAQASFYAVSFLPHGITLTQARFSLRLFGAAAIEAIPMVAEDFPIDAKYAPIVVFRRNLTDSEIRNLPWRAGQETGVFELSAKATDGEKAFVYGPVSAMAIEGYVKMPAPTPEIQRPVVPTNLELEAGFISLRDAATRMYEELKSLTHLGDPC